MPQTNSSHTALCGILLHPAGHTRSPAMHSAAYAALGMDAAYLAFDVPPQDLAAAIAGARVLGIRQLAVSIPHKEVVMQYLDEIDSVARTIGAVNTITRHGERLVGANTDWIGAVRALERETTLAGKRAVVLGSGGAARAVVYGLLARGASVTVLNRTLEKARSLAHSLGASAAGLLTDLDPTSYDLLINTTRVGLRSDESPIPAEKIAPYTIVMDAVYDPVETRLLRDAKARGATTIGGKWWLIEQAVEQIRLWTGKEAPRDVMEKAFDAAETLATRTMSA